MNRLVVLKDGTAFTAQYGLKEIFIGTPNLKSFKVIKVLSLHSNINDNDRVRIPLYSISYIIELNKNRSI